MTVESFTDANDALDDDDFAIIINKDGFLKGLWMPDDDDLEVPPIIINILRTHFKVDFDGKEERRLH